MDSHICGKILTPLGIPDWDELETGKTKKQDFILFGHGILSAYGADEYSYNHKVAFSLITQSLIEIGNGGEV